jgi:hypothetical protein
MMNLTFAVLGMVLGSISVVQPTKAAGNCEYIRSDYMGCHSYLCPNGCTLIVCPNPTNPAGPPEVGETCE